MKRSDDYELRRKHLEQLSDEQLKERFWALLDELTEPLVRLGYENTTPSIERSVLLRMGFSSTEAKSLVDGCMERSLLEHGAGNVVYRYAKMKDLDIRTAGLLLIDNDDWSDVIALFGEVEA